MPRPMPWVLPVTSATLCCSFMVTSRAVASVTVMTTRRRARSFRHATPPKRQTNPGPRRKMLHLSTALTQDTHGHRRFAQGLSAGPHHVQHLGPVSAVLQIRRAVRAAGNRYPARDLVGAVRLAGAAAVETSRLVAGAARAPEANRRADDLQPADRHQLADLR